MNFITINCGLNQTYSVKEEVFRQLIEQSINNIKGIKLDGEPRISFNKDKSNVSFVIDVKVKKNLGLQNPIESFREDFINKYSNILDIKPQSVRICFTGYY